MVSLVRVAGKNVFADEVATPRLLFRPADPIPNTGQIDLSTDTVRSGFTWFLNQPTAESNLSNVETGLDDLARQQNASPNASLPRILFGATANGQPWAVIKATMTGKAGSTAPADALRLCAQFNESTSYRVQVAPSVLSLENDAITFVVNTAMPHSFGKVDTNDSPLTVSTRHQSSLRSMGQRLEQSQRQHLYNPTRLILLVSRFASVRWAPRTIFRPD
jgi:hypothetical protein